MKSILLLLLLAGILPGASIDTKLFEGTEREAYYGQVLQQIDAAEVQGTISKALADEERMELDRLRRASAPSAPIERDGAAFLPQTPPNTTQAYYALQTAASMRLKAADAQQRLRDIQAKLAFLKRAVEDITAAEKPHLLSYQLQFAYYKVQ
jgi:potassium-dependent mechanosensitive channel